MPHKQESVTRSRDLSMLLSPHLQVQLLSPGDPPPARHATRIMALTISLRMSEFPRDVTPGLRSPSKKRMLPRGTRIT